MVMNICIWDSTTLQHGGVRIYPAISNKNLGTSRIYVFLVACGIRLSLSHRRSRVANL